MHLLLHSVWRSSGAAVFSVPSCYCCCLGLQPYIIYIIYLKEKCLSRWEVTAATLKYSPRQDVVTIFFPHAQTLTIRLSSLSSLWERFGSHSLLEDYNLSIQDTHRPCSVLMVLGCMHDVGHRALTPALGPESPPSLSAYSHCTVLLLIIANYAA